MQNNTNTNFQQAGRTSLYSTSNREYGSPWQHDGIRPERLDIKKAVIPTYSEVVDSLNDFKKAERLIKSKIVNEKLRQLQIDPENRMKKTNEFPIKDTASMQYPRPGINVGSALYRTNNMNYGSSVPANFQIPNKYHPCDSTFTKGFSGGNFKFNGLNTTKTVSNVHNGLNDM